MAQSTGFEAPMNLTYRQLFDSYRLSETLFRYKMLIPFRIGCLLFGLWRVYAAHAMQVQSGFGFRVFSHYLLAALFLAAALIPNAVSAAFARMRVMYTGSLRFEANDFFERIGNEKIRHKYDQIFALVRYHGNDFIFLSELACFVVDLDAVPGREGSEVRALLEERSGKTFRNVKFTW